MNKALEQKLSSEFPGFFRDLYGDPRRTCMAWGITTDDGWYDLIHDLCVKLKEVVDDKFYFKQVKEKFGILCCHTAGGNEKSLELISEAEKRSLTTCENCGKPGKIAYNKVLCDECS